MTEATGHSAHLTRKLLGRRGPSTSPTMLLHSAAMKTNRWSFSMVFTGLFIATVAIVILERTTFMENSPSTAEPVISIVKNLHQTASPLSTHSLPLKNNDNGDNCKAIVNGLDYAGQIDQDLRFFVEHGINETALNNALYNLHRAVMVHIRNNEIFVEFKHNKEHNLYLSPKGLRRWRGQLAVLLKASCYAKLPDVDFVMFLPDMVDDKFPFEYPFFHFQKKQNGQGILLPYASHIDDLRSFQKEIMKKPKYKWEKKEPKLIWRGSTTGGHYNRTNYDSFPRSKLVLACNNDQVALKDICDAAFIQFVQVNDPQDKAFLKEKFLLQSGISMEDHMLYKYIAWLDGNGPCSGRSEKLLFGNSLLLKQNSEFIEFYYSALKAYQHYVPVEADMSNLAEQMEWIRSNEDKARTIVARMNNFTQQLSPENVACYIQTLLGRYASLLTYELTPVHDLREARPVLPGNSYGLSPGSCRNPIYACKQYWLQRRQDTAFDTRTALLGDKGVIPEKCMEYFPMFQDELKKAIKEMD